jgi:hypothetical protein
LIEKASVFIILRVGFFYRDTRHDTRRQKHGSHENGNSCEALS